MAINDRWRPVYASPLLLSAYSPLALLAHNSSELHFSDGMRALAFSVAGAIAMVMILRWLTKAWNPAVMLSNLYLVLFFSYGHIYEALSGTELLGANLARHRYFIPVWMLFLVFGSWLLLRNSSALDRLMKPVLYSSAVLLILPLSQMLLFILSSASMLGARNANHSLIADLGIEPPDNPPDVYYIILDGYSREDVLEAKFDYDNSAFLGELETLGFYVADCGRSNYVKTRLSLASSLNMDYLQTFGVVSKQTNKLTIPLLLDGQVRSIFDQLGYTSIAFETNYRWTEWNDADFFITERSTQVHQVLDQIEHSILNDFEVMLLRTTAVRGYFDLSETILRRLFPDSITTTWTETFLNTPRITHYRRTKFVLHSLLSIVDYPTPKFVFAHIVSPHWPFVFSREGDFVSEPPSDPSVAYANQVAYLNDRIIEIVSRIISESDQPPIVILQGDHGAPGTEDSADRLKILNAYYLPDGGSSKLYANITPVNSFRLILDTYFGANMDLLEDRSYYSSPDIVFDFRTVPDDLPGCLVKVDTSPSGD